MNSFHCRWCFAVVIFFCSASAQAERIPIMLSFKSISDLLPSSNQEFEAAAPDTLILRAYRSRFPMEPTVFSELVLAGIEPDSADRMLNYKHGDPPSATWAITAANAGDYGLNWLGFQNTLIESRHGEAEVTLSFRNSAPPPNNPAAGGFDSIARYLVRAGVQIPGEGALAATDFQLHEINISLDYYFWHDVLEGLRAVQIQAEIRGEAETEIREIPEPSVPALLLLGLMLVGLPAPRRHAQRQRE
jgi:hypothetical protein